jgi:predicted  nucleic acid-binding Zn-ribbon protein
MANCQKYTRAACGHLFKHYERAKDENGEYLKFGNQEIDTAKSHLNYNLAPMQANGQGGFVKERCSEVKMQNRKDVNVMCSWVVTAPHEIRAEETERFFRETYKFLSERYGRDNVVSAYVHMDETTPHVHFAFVPIVRDKKKDILKVSAKEAINKFELQRFHNDLSGYMENVFGRDIGILNEATKEGNKTKQELQDGTAQRKLDEIKRETDELEKKKDKLTGEIKQSSDRVKSLKTEEKGLKSDIRELEKTFEGKKLTAEDLKNIKPTKGFFGVAKNVKYADITNLKKTAMTSLQDRIALNASKQEVEQLSTANADLTKQNAELKKKIPSFSQEMENNRLKIKIQDLERSQREANYIIKSIIAGVNELPEREREFMMNIIDPPEEHERRRSHDWER